MARRREKSLDPRKARTKKTLGELSGFRRGTRSAMGNTTMLCKVRGRVPVTLLVLLKGATPGVGWLYHTKDTKGDLHGVT